MQGTLPPTAAAKDGSEIGKLRVVRAGVGLRASGSRSRETSGGASRSLTTSATIDRSSKRSPSMNRFAWLPGAVLALVLLVPGRGVTGPAPQQAPAGKVDRFNAPLPPGAMARLGTL